jgi:cation transport regulator
MLGHRGHGKEIFWQEEHKERRGPVSRDRKAIDTLPSHAQHIYRRAHKNALRQYRNPSKRRGGKRQSREQVAHKVAWSAVKKAGYRKEGSRWEKS